MKYSLLLAFAVILTNVMPAIADENDRAPRTLSVTGAGAVQSVPDMADITIGVTNVAPTARAALDVNNAQTRKVFAFLQSAGVAARDMQSTNLSVSPQYRNRLPNDSGRPEIIGYMVNNNLRVAVRKLDTFGSILDGVVTAGANNINGIRFDVSERTSLAREATANAVKDAIAQATSIANAAGVKLGPILSISQSVGHRPPQAFLARSASQDVPIAAGELSIGASASIVFEIE
jgi:uncharacterized protein YggE